jgi:U3 small nucleolar RNA-associated protein 20
MSSKESPNGPQIATDILSPNVEYFLTQIGNLLRSQQDNGELLESCVETVADLTPFVTTSTQAQTLVDVSIFLLDQPRRVNFRTKGKILRVLEHFVPLYDLQHDAELKDRVYNTVTSLFGFFKDTPSREVLSRVLMVYSQTDPVLKEVAELCMDLNSLKEGRLDEPDYDRCSNAFTAIRDRKARFTFRQWTPLLYNMLYYIKDGQAFSIMSMGSSDAIKSFISNAAIADTEVEKVAFREMLSKILIPAIFTGVREHHLSETVRQEYVKIMGHLVKTFPSWSEVNDMYSLLSSEDELELSFFNNILTVGKGKQSSAMGQLSITAKKGVLNSKHVSQFFIPLIEHFVLDRAEGNDGHNLAAEATTTIGILAESLEWPQYRALLRRFIGYLKEKLELEKQIIKLLGKVIDALALAAQDLFVLGTDITSKERSTLAITMPGELKLATDLTSNVLPPLIDYLHDKDESTVSLRVPVAIIVVRLLKLLPQEQLNERLPPVLTDICHILRSKSQEARDMARDTLVRICVLLGPSCFGFVLKELRGALARGYQLHVLSYTMHSILVETTPEYAPGDIDYCLPSIVAIIMDDIFGVTGQEKDAEEYTSKMKEIKSSKSHDSMELIAKTATLSHLTQLVRPIQVLLKEKLNIKMARKIDELLNRISSGLLRNAAAESRDSLIFCYEIIRDVYNAGLPQAKTKEDYRLKKYLVQKGAKKSGERGSTTVYTYKLVRFSFDVLRTVVKKYDNLRTSSNLAGFIPVLANAVVEAEEEVRISAFRLLTTIVNVPMKGSIAGSDLYRIATAEAAKSISGSSSTTSDIVQASLKLVSVVMRDRRDVSIKDTVIDSLLLKLKEDITQPTSRHVTFHFLRAVLDSKVETAVVYDTLDYVREVMVTNDDKDTRDLARGAYFQFLRDYPQKKKRWTKQLEFIVANINYPREGGRLSILDVILLLLSRSSEDFVREVAAATFVHLVMMIANDESVKCRLLAGVLIKEIFSKADKEQRSTFLKLLRPLIERGESRTMAPALKIYGFYYESQQEDDSDLPLLLDCIYSTIKRTQSSDSDVELILGSLDLFTTILSTFPESLLSPNAARLWKVVPDCLSFPNARVKQSAAKLLRNYFADFARTNATTEFVGLPLKGSDGLRLSGDNINDLIRRSTNIFKTPELRMELAQEAVQLLAFLGIVASANHLDFKSQPDEESDVEDEEDEKETEKKRSALQYLIGRLSFTLRQETRPPRAPALIPKTCALALLGSLASKLQAPALLPSLQKILLPLHNITDTSIPIPYSTDEQFKVDYEALRMSSQAIMEALREKIGVEGFSAAMKGVREGVKERRMARSSKRKIAAVSNPEQYGKQKQKKGERKRERRKEKGQEHSQRRRDY